MIFEAIHHAFRAFERWHLTQKNRAIQVKYEKSCAALFRDLRASVTPFMIKLIAFNWTSKSYTAEAIRPLSKAVMLNAAVVPTAKSAWYRNGCGFLLKDT